MIGTQAEYARHAGITRQAVHKLKGLGRIPVRDDGRIDFAEADHARRSNGDPARRMANGAAANAGRDAGGGHEQQSFSQARTERELFNVQLAKLALEERLGALLPRQAIEEGMVECGRIIRRSIDSLVAQSDEIASIARSGGTDAVRQLLRKRVREIEQSAVDAMTSRLQEIMDDRR